MPVTKKQAVCNMLAYTLSHPQLQDTLKTVRMFMRGAGALMKLSIGKENTERVKLLCKDNVTGDELYEGLQFDKVPDAVIDEVVAFMDEQIKNIKRAKHSQAA